MKLWYKLFNFTFVNKNFATRIIKLNVSSDLKLTSCPNRTILSFSVIDTVFTPLSFMAICNCSQNGLMLAHLKKIWSIASRSFLQNEHVISFSTPIWINATFVANILCTNLIWNHLSFISRFFCIFLKVIFQFISGFSLYSHLSQQLGLLSVCINTSY